MQPTVVRGQTNADKVDDIQQGQVNYELKPVFLRYKVHIVISLGQVLKNPHQSTLRATTTECTEEVE